MLVLQLMMNSYGPETLYTLFFQKDFFETGCTQGWYDPALSLYEARGGLVKYAWALITLSLQWLQIYFVPQK